MAYKHVVATFAGKSSKPVTHSGLLVLKDTVLTLRDVTIAVRGLNTVYFRACSGFRLKCHKIREQLTGYGINVVNVLTLDSIDEAKILANNEELNFASKMGDQLRVAIRSASKIVTQGFEQQRCMENIIINLKELSEFTKESSREPLIKKFKNMYSYTSVLYDKAKDAGDASDKDILSILFDATDNQILKSSIMAARLS